MNLNNTQSAYISQSKSYLKILGKPYNIKSTNMHINLSVVETIIKTTYIFDNIYIILKSCIIKVSYKSDMAIIWINIWDSQSSTSTKTLINYYFNIESYITTIQGTNINPDIFQYKNYQKQRHITFACQAQGSYYVKYNSLHKIEHYCHFTWCCKANSKTNPLCLETKQGKLCPYNFKYLNCKEDHQTDFNSCSFQRHHFNEEQYSKKYQELQKTRKKLIYLTVSRNQA